MARNAFTPVPGAAAATEWSLPPANSVYLGNPRLRVRFRNVGVDQNASRCY
jgi:hypothetical protein